MPSVCQLEFSVHGADEGMLGGPDGSRGEIPTALAVLAEGNERTAGPMATL